MVQGRITVKILIQTDEDRLFLRDGTIKALSGGKEYTIDISRVEQAVIITTDMGPFYDDMALALRTDDGNAVFILSSHPDYEAFLFDSLGKTLEIDYQAIIDASSCTENKIFVIYNRD